MNFNFYDSNALSRWFGQRIIIILYLKVKQMSPSVTNGKL